ncbi:MAG: glutamine synthetase type III, partial [Bacteroidales bacterium]|nr:glutamine synthetase type III [Bacteroidales bacterium]
YGEDWLREAEKRKLANTRSVPEALDVYMSEKTINLYTSLGGLDQKELEGQTGVRLEMYTKKIQIEARVLGDLAINHIVPTAVRYQSDLLVNVKAMKDILQADEFKKMSAARIDRIREISNHVSEIKSQVNKMVEARKKANKIENVRGKAGLYNKDVLPYLEIVRDHIDRLELIVDNEMWPLPKYRELLFVR